MTNIQINDGLQTFSLNGKCEITYNPTDMDFIDEIYTMLEKLDAQQSEYQSEAAKLTKPREIFDFARKHDELMRNAINEWLGADVCTALFGRMNMYAMNGEGLPLWAGLIFAIYDTMDAAVKSESAKTSSKFDKYLKKYHR